MKEKKLTNAQKVERSFQKVRHYVVRDGNTPVGTVTIGVSKSGCFCRGVSIASVADRFNKYKGVQKSLGRMLAALDSAYVIGHHIEPIRKTAGVTEMIGQLTKNKPVTPVSREDRANLSLARFLRFCPVRFKGSYGIRPTAFERELLKD